MKASDAVEIVDPQAPGYLGAEAHPFCAACVGVWIAALVLLILFWKELSTGAAGCFTNMTGPKEGGAATSAPADASETAPSPEPEGEPTNKRSVTIKVPEKADKAPE